MWASHGWGHSVLLLLCGVTRTLLEGVDPICLSLCPFSLALLLCRETVTDFPTENTSYSVYPHLVRTMIERDWVCVLVWEFSPLTLCS